MICRQSCGYQGGKQTFRVIGAVDFLRVSDPPGRTPVTTNHELTHSAQPNPLESDAKSQEEMEKETYVQIDVESNGELPENDAWLVSLQELSRRCILGCLTKERLDDVHKLPLPMALKNYLSTFLVPNDFDTSGIHFEYNFHFPFHPHHKFHRLYPALCTFDKSRVLMKTQIGSDVCKMCQVLGHRLKFRQSIADWTKAHHSNLQNCILKMKEANTNVLYYVFEYPKMSMRDLLTQIYYNGGQIPEYLIWQTLEKVSSLVIYLNDIGLKNELNEPRFFIIDEKGEVKLENLLIYLPSENMCQVRTSIPPASVNYNPPEERFDIENGELDDQEVEEAYQKSVIWGLGCLLYELIALHPAFVSGDSSSLEGSPSSEKDINQAPLPQGYSNDIKAVIYRCLSRVPSDRPDIRALNSEATRMLETHGRNYDGPNTLLDILARQEPTIMYI